ncbi:LysR family transcriptional regulator [Oceanobacillus profundus]|uniref:LysR family transcriptional regulator n=1 Tax=Oceanobacillus profundus TaxID=372463 RepID=UPI003628000C
MELRHLRYFVAVAKHLHFNEAALELNISQPPLSKQIKQLEDELGVILLWRTNRKVELTEAGEYFFNAANRILKLVEKEINVTKEIACGEIGSLTIGFGGSVVYDLLPNIIKQMNEIYPNIKLEVRQLTTSDQVRLLQEGTIDVGFLVPPINEDDITNLPIREEPFVACVPLNHRLSQSQHPVEVMEFERDRVIMTPEKSGKGYYDSIIALCRNAGFYPNITQTAQEQQTIVSLVASEIGIAFVPKTTERIVHENVKYLPLKQQHKKITALAWHKDNHKPVIGLFVDLIKSYLLKE